LVGPRVPASPHRTRCSTAEPIGIRLWICTPWTLCSAERLQSDITLWTRKKSGRPEQIGILIEEGAAGDSRRRLRVVGPLTQKP